MAVALDLSDPGPRKTRRKVAAWTIHAVVFGLDGKVAAFHDCGAEMTAHLTSEKTGVLVRHRN